MSVIPLPAQEHERLVQLGRCGLLGSQRDERFAAAVEEAAAAFAAPVALFSIVGCGEQWFKARVGTELTATSREHSFCTHAMLEREPMVVLDARLDRRFADNPLVTEAPFIRFYAGAPVIVNGLSFGALCVIDTAPRTTVEASALRRLTELANEAASRIEEDAFAGPVQA